MSLGTAVAGIAVAMLYCDRLATEATNPEFLFSRTSGQLKQVAEFCIAHRMYLHAAPKSCSQSWTMAAKCPLNRRKANLDSFRRNQNYEPFIAAMPDLDHLSSTFNIRSREQIKDSLCMAFSCGWSMRSQMFHLVEDPWIKGHVPHILHRLGTGHS